MHQARGAGKRKSPKRFSLLTSVLIGDTEVERMDGVGMGPVVRERTLGYAIPHVVSPPHSATRRGGVGTLRTGPSVPQPQIIRRERRRPCGAEGWP